MGEHPPRREATYEDLEKLSPDSIGELVAGELHASPRPTLRHARVILVLLDELVGPFDRGKEGPGGWLFLPEPELHLGRDVLVPDVAGWRRERMPETPDTVGARLPPDWVCEVLSPSTMALDRGRKMGVYAREGVQHVWLVDPDARILEVYRREGRQWLLLSTHVDASEVRAEPFEAIAMELRALWARG